MAVEKALIIKSKFITCDFIIVIQSIVFVYWRNVRSNWQIPTEHAAMNGKYSLKKAKLRGIELVCE